MVVVVAVVVWVVVAVVAVTVLVGDEDIVDGSGGVIDVGILEISL